MAIPRRIAIACGGTAGHVYPALALADAYRESYPEAEILFIGTPAGLESSLVTARGYRLELIPGTPLAREPLIGKLQAPPATDDAPPVVEAAAPGSYSGEVFENLYVSAPVHSFLRYLAEGMEQFNDHIKAGRR